MNKKIKPPNNKKEKSMTKMIGWVFTNEADAKGTKEENKKAWEKLPDEQKELYFKMYCLVVNIDPGAGPQDQF